MKKLILFGAVLFLGSSTVTVLAQTRGTRRYYPPQNSTRQYRVPPVQVATQPQRFRYQPQPVRSQQQGLTQLMYDNQSQYRQQQYSTEYYSDYAQVDNFRNIYQPYYDPRVNQYNDFYQPRPRQGNNAITIIIPIIIGRRYN